MAARTPASSGVFTTAMDRFLRFMAAERGASPFTLKSYREDLLQLEEFLQSAGCRGPADASSGLLRRFQAGLGAAGYAPSTVARKLASMRSFYAFGQREGWVKVNPAKPLRSPRRPRKLPTFLTGAEIAKLLVAPDPAAPGGIAPLLARSAVAVGGRYAGDGLALAAGTPDVAVIPPVSGG